MMYGYSLVNDWVSVFYEINLTIMLGNSVYYNIIGKKARVILKNFDSD